jgi:hypothetical protein
MSEARVAVHPLDFAALVALRRERAARGFLSTAAVTERYREA